MNEVKKCSISGVGFTMDIDAYETLAAYLESLKTAYGQTPDGSEIIADIEARIAELILSAQDSTRVVEKPLILNIIQQMGTAEDISESHVDDDLHHEQPRIPRRLYRDVENAKLGGVCAGIGKYFDLDPVWIRMGLFLPILLTCFSWVPFFQWAVPLFPNLFVIFVICYFIMWFAIPTARSARQKLEMNGEKITAQAIGQVTAASNDPDAKAKPIIADVVSTFGQVVLILLKIFAGLIVFGLIMGACALIIGLFAVSIGGSEFAQMGAMEDFSIWIPITGIIATLIPVILLIYVLMCMIASRKPGGKTVLVIFILWMLAIITCASIAIHDHIGQKFHKKRSSIEQMLNHEVIINGDTTTLQRALEEFEDESITEEDENIHISVPSQAIDITVKKGDNDVKVEAIEGNDSIKITKHNRIEATKTR